MGDDRHYSRVISHADRDLETGCLVSRYSTGSHGYAQAWNGVTVVLAHRMVWQHIQGSIAPGMTIDHVCHNRKCIEVTHMRCITNLENARMNNAHLADMESGFCVNGHEDITWWRPKGPTRKKGYCAKCRADRRKTE